MDKAHLLKLTKGSLVLWPDEGDVDYNESNAPFGWNDSMDYLIDIPIVSQGITIPNGGVDGVRVEHPQTGSYYTMRADKLIIVSDAAGGLLKWSDGPKAFDFGEYTYLQIELLNEERLRNVLLGEDFMLFMSTFKLGTNQFFHIDKENYLTMKHKCPRVIGALIGYGYLQKDAKN